MKIISNMLLILFLSFNVSNKIAVASPIPGIDARVVGGSASTQDDVSKLGTDSSLNLARRTVAEDTDNYLAGTFGDVFDMGSSASELFLIPTSTVSKPSETPSSVASSATDLASQTDSGIQDFAGSIGEIMKASKREEKNDNEKLYHVDYTVPTEGFSSFETDKMLTNYI